MSRAAQSLRRSVAGVVATVVLSTGVSVVHPTAAGATPQTYQAITSVNVRTGPGTTHPVIGVLRVGQVVEATGPAVDGWLPITFSSQSAFVSATYVTAAGTEPVPHASGLPGTRRTLVDVNVRARASLTADIVTTLSEGSEVKGTGRTQDGFAEIVLDGAARWIYARFLSADTTAIVQPPPASPSAMTTTASLVMRSAATYSSTNLGSLAAGSPVTITGTHTGSYTGVTVDDQTRWVLSGYLVPAAGSDAPALPRATGKRWVTANGVNIREAADVDAARVTSVDTGTLMVITGVVAAAYTQVIWDGDVRYVATSYLSATKPATTSPGTSTPVTGSLGSTSLDRLNAYGKALVVEIRARFPQISTIYGWRSYSAYSSDHPSGRAVDIMIPSYKTNRALGDAIAQYIIDNHQRLHVKYLIWRQRNYTISRGYWVSMSDRGGDTANHYDHVHVSLYDVP